MNFVRHSVAWARGEILEMILVAVAGSALVGIGVVGAPRYLEKRGTPERPEDLTHHECLTFRSETTGALYAWELERGKRTWRVPVRGPIVTNDGLFTIGWAQQGLGLAYVMEPLVERQLREGKLRRVLEPYAVPVSGFHALKSKQIPVSYVVFPDEGHGFARPENTIAFFAVAEAFLSVHLGGFYEPIRASELSVSSLSIEHGLESLLGLPQDRSVATPPSEPPSSVTTASAGGCTCRALTSEPACGLRCSLQTGAWTTRRATRPSGPWPRG